MLSCAADKFCCDSDGCGVILDFFRTSKRCKTGCRVQSFEVRVQCITPISKVMVTSTLEDSLEQFFGLNFSAGAQLKNVSSELTKSFFLGGFGRKCYEVHHTRKNTREK